MQDKEQRQKEIDTVKLQLSIADMSAMTASPEEKEHWEARRASLQERLASLQKEAEENVVYDGSNAASILDDATADAMLNEILSADETPASAMEPDAMEPDDPDEMLSRILQQTDDTADGALRGKMQYDAEKEGKDEQEPVDNILFTADDGDASSVLNTDEADALLNELLADNDAAQREEAAQSEEHESSAVNTDEEAQAVIVPAPPVEDERSADAQEQTAQEETTQEEVLRTIREDVPPTEMSEPIAEVEPTFVAPPEPIRFTSPAEGYNAEIERLRREAEEANRKAQEALKEAERMRREAEEIRLAAETERAMYAAEIELQRGLRAREDSMRNSAEQAEKDKLAEKIARRKAEISALRNELQNIKDSESAFALREKLLAVQLVFDEDERSNAELSYLLTKTIDDVAHMLEVVELKRKITALVAARKAAPKAAKRKPAAKKAAPKKKKKPAGSLAHRRRPPLRAASRRRPAPRYR